MPVANVIEFQPVSRAPRPAYNDAWRADPLGVNGVRVAFGRGEKIFGEEQPANHVYRVIDGAVRTSRLRRDGRRQIDDFYLPGDVFGVEVDGEHHLTAEAVGPALVLMMRRRQLMDRAGLDCDTARRLWALAMHELERSREHMLLLGRMGALERVVSFIIDMARRIPAHRDVDLPMSRQDMADYLALTIETVSRTMTQMQEDGLITLAGSRRVVLRDRHAMEIIAAG